MFRRHFLCAEDEHQQGHHHHAATNAKQARGKADQRTNAEVGRPLHQARSRSSTSSAKPAPEDPCVTNLGVVLTREASRLMFATPVDYGKNSHIRPPFRDTP